MKHLRSIIQFEELKASGTIDEFYRYHLQNNLSMLFIACVFLLFSESILLILPEHAFNYHPVLLNFVVIDLVLVIFMLIVRSNYKKYQTFTLSLIQHVSIVNILVLATGLNFASINAVDYIHPVIISLTFLSIAFEVKPMALILYTVGTILVNLTGMVMLHTDPDALFSLATNFTLFALIAYLLGIVVSRIRISDWLNTITVRRQNEMLEDLIKRDPMTRLFNHESILSHLHLQIQFRKQYGNPLSVLILDIDDFKKINDTFGHL